LDVLEDTQAVDPFDHVSNREHRALLLSQLTDPERRVLRLRFGFEPAGEQSLNEIASELSITLRRVREIAAQALEKLRRSLEP
jgi:RNA polymerase primary sigma factor